ncbi:MAG: hypothetical protein N4A65_11315 [Cohaesibacter sp.]|jgi:hypothetical protein|nr:hypothetical protein [Cohaesibacter sp.]
MPILSFSQTSHKSGVCTLLLTGSLSVLLTGCSDYITAKTLGVDKIATNQCLASDQYTNEGIVIPKGTKGYLQNNNGRDVFVLTNRMTGTPIAYDITGQRKTAGSCSSVSQLTTASIKRPPAVIPPAAIPPAPIPQAGVQMPPPVYRQPMPVQPYPQQQLYQPQPGVIYR